MTEYFFHVKYFAKVSLLVEKLQHKGYNIFIIKKLAHIK